MLNINDTTVIGIDLQEKLVNMLSIKDKISVNCLKLLKTCNILNLNTILTEQYPQGLGSTISTIKEIKNFNTIEKISFSALQNDDFLNALSVQKTKNIVLFGIETHICVYQTALELIEKGFSVYIVKDCCASRALDNHDCALELLKQFGAKITTLEIVLFELLKTSKHKNFKEIQALIK